MKLRPWEHPIGHSEYGPRNIERVPYSRQEKRVVEYLNASADLGGGDDPVGFLIACHAWLRSEVKQLRVAELASRRKEPA